MEIILATTNQGKVKEIKKILAKLPLSISSLNDYQDIPEIIEDGDTFLDNALIKTHTIYNLFNKPVIADDSGLVIPVLNGEPGVKSARYGCDNNEKPTPELLIQRVLKNMEGISKEKRQAHFKSVMVLMINNEEKIIAEGACHGVITDKPTGDGGFGYDPIFFLPEFNKTMAQLTLDEKNNISHRGKALNQLKEKLEQYLSSK